MSTIPPISPPATPGSSEVIYPSSDGRPVGETPLHRDILFTTIDVLRRHFAADQRVYVSGNMLVFYEKGNKRKHVSPDVFVAFGIPRDKVRDQYLVWEEGHGPEVVLEITSSSTRVEDQEQKFVLYRDNLNVPEYFLFDPRGEYLDGQLRGFRLREGRYEPIAAVGGRLPSEVLDLHLEADREDLRLFDPSTQRRLPTQEESKADAESKAAEMQLEIERLRREIEALRRQQSGG